MCGDHTGYHAGSEGFLELCSTLKGRHEMMDCMGLVNRVFYGALKNKIWDKKTYHGHYLIRTFRPFLKKVRKKVRREKRANQEWF